MAAVEPYQLEPEYSSGEERDYDFEESNEEEGFSTQFSSDTSRKTSTSWCSCGKCLVMATVVECVCCRELSFLSKTIEGLFLLHISFFLFNRLLRKQPAIMIFFKMKTDDSKYINIMFISIHFYFWSRLALVLQSIFIELQ
mgnify:CR=1 FL=1